MQLDGYLLTFCDLNNKHFNYYLADLENVRIICALRKIVCCSWKAFNILSGTNIILNHLSYIFCRLKKFYAFLIVYR